MKFLILMPYFNRPILVRNALTSILRASEHHDNWELGFGDDNSKIPGRPIVEEILKDHLDKVRFDKSDMTFDDKVKHGLIFGKLANKAIAESDADVAIILCDDDEFVPTYMKELASFFTDHPEILYCYSKVHLYNPLLQKSDSVDNITGKYNQWDGPINPVNKVDASQVAWRLECCKVHGAGFADSTLCVPGKPWIKDTDKSFFENLYEHCGDCHPSGLVAQYKGVHDHQLLWHKNASRDSLLNYHKRVEELSGVDF